MNTAQSKEKEKSEALKILGECWTIDSGDNPGDNKFLQYARVGHPEAGAHGSTKQVVDNLLLGCLAPSKKEANIVGHGNTGLIITGTGQICCTPGKAIRWWDHDSWKAEISRLKGNVSIIKLWACHPGTGTEGVNLLNYMSQDSGAQCWGATGILYSYPDGHFELQDGSTWQIVTPGQPLPQPIPAPQFKREQMVVIMKISNKRGYENVPLENIDTVEILSPDRQQTRRTLKDQEARSFLQVINFDDPFVIEGVPAAIVTGYIRVHLPEPVASRIGKSRDFIVWNDLQLEDAEQRGHFYDVVGDLRSMMRELA